MNGDFVLTVALTHPGGALRSMDVGQELELERKNDGFAPRFAGEIVGKEVRR